MKKALISLLTLGVFFFGVVFAWQKVLAVTQTPNRSTKEYGDYITKDYNNISAFTSLSVVGIPDVEFVQSTTENITVSVYAPQRIISDHIEIKSTGNTLTVSTIGNIRAQYPIKIKVFVSGPKLTQMNVSGSGDITVKGLLETPSLTAAINGSGDIEIGRLKTGSASFSVKGSGDVDVKWIECEDVEASVSGSGDIELNGTANNAKYSVNGSGDVDADELKATNVTANVSGSGDVECHAVSSLKATVNGSGNIKYRGNPEGLQLIGKSRSFTHNMY